MSGNVPAPVPLMFVQVALVPPAATTPRHTCDIPNPDMTTMMVLMSSGLAATSQMYWPGRGAAWIAEAVQVVPLLTSRYTFPNVVPAYRRFELTYWIAETRSFVVSKPGRLTFVPQPPVPCAASRLMSVVPSAMLVGFVWSSVSGG